MKLNSIRTRQHLGQLQEDVRRLCLERTTALQLLSAARASMTVSGQREFWFEFKWVDQEYRYAVFRLAAFCREFDLDCEPRDRKRPARNRSNDGARG